ncbi:MAG: thioredoxin domain-containing protein [Bacteroidales bacterium]|nr:thioredoxin domain-containing protein [Bacteroidales bacterium]
MNNKQVKTLLLILILIINISCKNEKSNVVAVINDEKIYQNQIDSLIRGELYQLRKEALKSYISRLLFEHEAKIKNISTSELKDKEIIRKAKKVKQADINEYVRLNKITDFDSVKVKNTLANINQRFRFEVYIDSLKTAQNVIIIDNSTYSNSKDLDMLHSHSIIKNNSKLQLYFIADYNCSSCQNHYERILELCDSYNGIVQFNFVPYPGDLENNKVFFAEALSMQNKFWEFNDDLFVIDHLTDSIISYIIQLYSIDSTRLMLDYNKRINFEKIDNNKRILEDMDIYSVPTLIVSDIIIPGYTSSDELIQIINYKLYNN